MNVNPIKINECKDNESNKDLTFNNALTNEIKIKQQ